MTRMTGLVSLPHTHTAAAHVSRQTAADNRNNSSSSSSRRSTHTHTSLVSLTRFLTLFLSYPIPSHPPPLFSSSHSFDLPPFLSPAIEPFFLSFSLSHTHIIMRVSIAVLSLRLSVSLSLSQPLPLNLLVRQQRDG